MKDTVEELLYGYTRCYLIGQRIMVDTGWAGTFPALARCLKEKRLSLETIPYLLLTHFHPDHMGIAQDVAEHGVQIIVFEEQRNFIHQSDSIFLKDKKTVFHPIQEKNLRMMACRDSRAFFKSIGISGEVLSTPGHSSDSISIVLDEGSAIVGDLPPLALAQAYHDEKMDQSWGAILSHPVHTVYYGHAGAGTVRVV